MIKRGAARGFDAGKGDNIFFQPIALQRGVPILLFPLFKNAVYHVGVVIDVAYIADGHKLRD